MDKTAIVNGIIATTKAALANDKTTDADRTNYLNLLFTAVDRVTGEARTALIDEVTALIQTELAKPTLMDYQRINLCNNLFALMNKVPE